MRSLIKFVPAVAALALFATACHHDTQNPDQVRSVQGPQFTATQLKSAQDDAKAKGTNNGLVQPGAADLDAALNELANVSVFFAFDDSTLTPEAQAKLTKVADVLVKYPALTIQVQGNTDERGTEAYNLALGQRRADSARGYLTRLGVKDGQITTVSFGDEKPKAATHDEAAYQQNRRDDVVAK